MGEQYMKKPTYILAIIIFASFFMVSTSAAFPVFLPHKQYDTTPIEDYDPLVDITVTVEIEKIRAFDKHDRQVHRREYVDRFSDPDFYVKVFINEEEFTSDIWRNTKYIYDPAWSATVNVPDDEELVNISIELWDWEPGRDKICDISGDYDGILKDTYDIELTYSIATGHWWGDDSSSALQLDLDPSGYGRANGCDDNSIYQHERDCELWFNIYQNDYDNDSIPYWTETNIYGTDPELDNTGEDNDGDGCPIEWEHKWGHVYYWWHDEHFWIYDDNTYNDHANIDTDNDGLNNIQEYQTAQWGSDPYRKDIFTELDQMEPGPDVQESYLPNGAKELLYTAFNRQNIVYHLDDGTWIDSKSDILPFDESTTDNELEHIYHQYFLNNDTNNWRRDIFHYGLVIYNAERYPGFCFGSNRFQISSLGMEKKVIPNTQKTRDVVYASAYMHETGHTLGFWPIGGHDDNSKYPWQLGWWKWRPYKSCMNYGYMYTTVDYSDGSRGRNDFDDWSRLDLTYFQN